MVWLRHSVCPSVWGCKAVDILGRMPDSLRNSCQVLEVNRESRSETISEGSLWYPDFPSENDRQIGCRFLFLVEGEEVCHFRESVDDHPHLVASFRTWQFRDEIHRDGLLRGIRDFQRGGEPVRLVSDCLVFLALRTASDVVNDSLIHFWPPEVSSYQFNRLVLAHVTGYP